MGLHIDAYPPRQAWTTGKVEDKVRLGRLRVDPRRRRFESLESLQAWTDERLEAWAAATTCSVTGLTVQESWRGELEVLATLPLLPEPFDVAVTRPVHKDCMVNFENRSNPVPYPYVGRRVEVRGCAGMVQILANDEVMATALLDRLLHQCHVISVRGRSYRLRGLEKLMK